MCGISAIAGENIQTDALAQMIAAQRHRGPDGDGSFVSPDGRAVLGHNRLRIIDLSERGAQPMLSPNGRYALAFNGEIYNYKELRAELGDYRFRSETDTEVVLAAYERWGIACLDRLIGMFAFVLWDQARRELIGARDRFGVKPLYLHRRTDGTLLVASEIGALHAAGVTRTPDPITWAGYLSAGSYGGPRTTFWREVDQLPAGHAFRWCGGELAAWCWYDLPARIGAGYDERRDDDVRDEYLALLDDSIRLRFRADVPVGINLSGGLDSSLLLALVHRYQGPDSEVSAFTFATGDPSYDELPWVERMLSQTRHPAVVCQLSPDEVPALAASVQAFQDEPFGGLPTVTYARLFEIARERGTIVLLDGQGMDEQWAGYDYYRRTTSTVNVPIQGTLSSPVRPGCLSAAFRELAATLAPPTAFPDALRNSQLRDLTQTKLPRALRFNDRISMRSSTELREPFLDHRLVELALRQPPQRKIDASTGKRLLRALAAELIPSHLRETPKRPVQTPQREWLRGPLKQWASEQIETALHSELARGWLDEAAVRREWEAFCGGAGDNAFWVWQWISIGMLEQGRR
jgi:asparagine synthase (glutamine-hydrolysing)